MGILRCIESVDKTARKPCVRPVAATNKKAALMWIPEWLYKRLPLIYGVAGLACLWFFDSTLHGLPSALLFFAAALRTHTLRRLERKAGPLDSKRRLPHVRNGKHRSPRYARD